MDLDSCEKCRVGKMLYNPQTEALECTECNNHDDLGGPTTEEDYKKENEKELAFLRMYNNFKLLG